MYLVKKSKPGRPALRSERHQDPVFSSLPGSSRRKRRKSPACRQDQTQWLNREFRVLDRYELQAELTETLRRTRRYSHLVPRVASCNHSFGHWVCDHRHEWAQPKDRCNVRLCPHCQRLRSIRLAARWSKLLLGKTELRYVVFAERNSADLGEGMESLYRAWARLRKMPIWKDAATGAVAVLEVTYNREHNTWHPHLNVLFEGSYIPFEALKQAWFEATDHQGQTAFIRGADAGTIRELLKYVTKLSDFVDQPEAVDHFLHAVARKRFIRTYGSFYHLPVEEDDHCGHCPDCDSSEIVCVGPAYADQIVLDDGGVMRILAARLRYSQRPCTEDIEVSWPRAPVDRGLADARWKQFTKQYQEKN